jgi:DNA repair protein RAD50
VPPGTNNGQLFVHDPKVYHSNECLGQVKLMVRDGRGNKITVTRSMKTAQKKLKRQFQTLDATIHFESCDGKVVNSISGRCLDVTKEMCTYMGVTKAIISNVILCHQEDSNWPLDEAKKLKEKFDAMFGTTEYNKAIERIIKQRKGFMEKHKDLKSALAIREYEKADAEKKSMELHVNEEKLKTLQSSTEQLQQQMGPLLSRLQQIAKVEMEISQMEGRRVALSTK